MPSLATSDLGAYEAALVRCGCVLAPELLRSEEGGGGPIPSIVDGCAAAEMALPVRWGEVGGCVAVVFKAVLAPSWTEAERCVEALFKAALPARWDEADGRVAAILEVTAAGGFAVVGSFRRVNWG